MPLDRLWTGAPARPAGPCHLGVAGTVSAAFFFFDQPASRGYLAPCLGNGARLGFVTGSRGLSLGGASVSVIRYTVSSRRALGRVFWGGFTVREQLAQLARGTRLGEPFC